MRQKIKQIVKKTLLCVMSENTANTLFPFFNADKVLIIFVYMCYHATLSDTSLSLYVKSTPWLAFSEICSNAVKLEITAMH